MDAKTSHTARYEIGSQGLNAWFISFTVFTYIALISILSGSFSQLHAQVNEDRDKTLSPYFFIQSDDPTLDQLPLKSTTAEINIAGVIADVRVTQTYKNEGKKTLEAIYIFPASTRAAVYGMQMTIGERTIVAKIDRKSAAREEYERAREEGYTAALLEQHRPNVYQMKIANILPGDVIKVDLRYTELLIPQDKQYEFIYPTVVGPRYSNVSAENAGNSEKWIKNPYLTEGEIPNYDFNLKIVLNSGVPLQKVISTSHQVDISYSDKNSAHIKLKDSEKDGGNRDFILKYQLAGQKIQSGLLLFEGTDENFFLAMIQPPKESNPELIVPREYIFIIDVSGSMNGFPISITKDLMRNLLGKLKPSEKFNVLLFAGGSRVFNQKSVSATESNIKKAIYMIDNEHGSGGTQLLPALKKAMALPQTKGFSRTIVIVTDGYISVERQAFDLIRNNLGEANVFTFGIGSSVNRYLIEGLSRVGKGESFVVTENSEANIKADKFRNYIKSPLLTNIKIQYESFNAYSFEPAHIPDVFAERPILIFGKYRGEAGGRIILTGVAGDNRNFKTQLNVSDYQSEIKNSALGYLWARERIALLSDYARVSQDEQEIEEVTNLGLKYSLLTEYTSFVAVDSELRNESGQITSVKQPLPLPQGVSNFAVGGRLMSAVGYGSRGKIQKSMGPANTLAMEVDEEQKIAEPVVKIVKIDVSKKSEIDIIKSFIKQNKGIINFCYTSKIRQMTESFPEGEIELMIVFSKNGKVLDIKVTRDDLNENDITDCIIKKLGRLGLNNYQSNSELKVTVVLAFEK